MDPLIRFGTVGSPQSTPQTGTLAAIEQIRRLGMDHLEIAWVRSVRVSDETCAAIKNTAETYNVSLSIHAPYFINLNSQTAELMAKSDERLLTAARKGYLAGARDIVFHPGSYHDQSPDHVYERVKEKLLELRGILDEEGIDVSLRPETMGKKAMFGTLDELVQLSRDIPGVLPCIDFAHLHARDGQFNTYDEFAGIFRTVEEYLGRAGLESLHAHMSGIDYGPRGEKSHLPLNEADIRYQDLIQA
ncbi:MAG: TIM barrel protein, partial [Anaerolineae bacterium]|nr:TIM barrel protein [Anaerolineae bacterium]